MSIKFCGLHILDIWWTAVNYQTKKEEFTDWNLNTFLLFYIMSGWMPLIKPLSPRATNRHLYCLASPFLEMSNRTSFIRKRSRSLDFLVNKTTAFEKTPEFWWSCWEKVKKRKICQLPRHTAVKYLVKKRLLLFTRCFLFGSFPRTATSLVLRHHNMLSHRNTNNEITTSTIVSQRLTTKQQHAALESLDI